jgi:hypothetical protein
MDSWLRASRRLFRYALATTAAAFLCGAQPALEDEVKATFVYKFTPFVDWPASAFESSQAPLSICIVGDDQVAKMIDQAAAGQKDGDRPIVMRHLDRVEPNSPCHVLYAAASPRQTVAQALAAVEGRPVLTVTDLGTSPTAKGMIAFVMQDNRVRFDIDEKAANSAGLMISSRLLGLARNVDGRN